MKKYVTKVVAGPDDSIGILMTPELIEAMKLVEDEILQWEVMPDGSIVITRPAFVYQSEAKK